MLQRGHAVLDAPRPVLGTAAQRRFVTQSVTKGIPTRSVRNDKCLGWGMRNDRCLQDRVRRNTIVPMLQRGHAVLDAPRPVPGTGRAAHNH
ncbi:hypothetical protein AO069_22175 [Pseudomonas syringae pv. syringae PD2774]|nr:hypothetical protein AO069_22175 [Pseudomonas syringae pv. syringae PD2774]